LKLITEAPATGLRYDQAIGAIERIENVTPSRKQSSNLGGEILAACARLAPRPTCIEDTGLSQLFLADLVSKHIAVAGVLDVHALSRRLGLPGSVVEEVIDFMRTEGIAELRATRDDRPLLRFGLTDRGRVLANDAAQRDGYVGPAPVPLEVYTRLVSEQSVNKHPVTRSHAHETFSDTVIRPELLDRLGPAMSSGRSLFIYGHPGTGKSYIARQLSRLLGPPVLLPYALIVAETVVVYFDANVHRVISDSPSVSSTLLAEGFDARFALCERPFISSGGELTIDMLELRYDASTRRHVAPLQMRANMGMLLIDDLGRQRISAADLFNRWIVPLDERRDQLALNSGQHFSVPFDVVLIFSTNIDPHELADDAFLRRIGYKIQFDTSSPSEYAAIWQQECEKNGTEFDPALVDHVLTQLYPHSDVPPLACHPRDLLGLGLDYARYRGRDSVGEEAIQWAWHNYFVEV
jgi:hypothetical protein